MQENDSQNQAALFDVSFGELAAALSADYESIFVIDSENDNYVEYRIDSSTFRLTPAVNGTDFFGDTFRNIRVMLHPDDQEYFLKVFRKENFLDALAHSRSFSLNYRLIINGETQHYFLKTIRSGGESRHIFIGVRNVNEEVRRHMESERLARTYSTVVRSLASLYEAIYYVDTETEEYIKFTGIEECARLGLYTECTDFFRRAADNISKIVHPDDQKALLDNLEKKNLIAALAEAGTVQYTYRQMLEARSRYVTVMAVQPHNDKHHIIMAVFNVDAQMRREQAMANKNQTFEEIVRALASRYEVIYYVDLHTNEYQEYCSSAKYARLSIGTTGHNFFGETQENIKQDIYPEDYPLMAECMTKEHLLESMDETGTTAINYRLMLDGEPQYVTLFAIRPKEDSQHIIIAVANVDAAKRRELAYRDALGSAIDMASRDALTGVKNKHAYVRTETELDSQIEEDINPDFAIVVHDINGLKNVNDTQGHRAGDLFIQSACEIICRAFQHSPVYRIGGDEFAVVLRGHDYEHREEIMTALRSQIAAHVKSGQVTVASGISEFVRGEDLHVQDVFERADRAMYADKQRFRKT